MKKRKRKRELFIRVNAGGGSQQDVNFYRRLEANLNITWWLVPYIHSKALG